MIEIIICFLRIKGEEKWENDHEKVGGGWSRRIGHGGGRKRDEESDREWFGLKGTERCGTRRHVGERQPLAEKADIAT